MRWIWTSYFGCCFNNIDSAILFLFACSKLLVHFLSIHISTALGGLWKFDKHLPYSHEADISYRICLRLRFTSQCIRIFALVSIVYLHINHKQTPIDRYLFQRCHLSDSYNRAPCHFHDPISWIHTYVFWYFTLLFDIDCSSAAFYNPECPFSLPLKHLARDQIFKIKEWKISLLGSRSLALWDFQEGREEWAWGSAEDVLHYSWTCRKMR